MTATILGSFQGQTPDSGVSIFASHITEKRGGYPPMKKKPQAWRANSHVSFGSKSDISTEEKDATKHIVQGGRVYFASTG